MPGSTTAVQTTESAQPDKYLTKKEVAALFRVTPRTIDDWMVKRYLPYFKLGRNVRFRKSEIDAQLDESHRFNRYARR